MKQILLRGKYGKDKFALVDDEDFEKLNNLKWCLTNGGYIIHSIRINKTKIKQILMHRFILNAPKKFFVDHINRNTLDNRKQNLRLVTNMQNLWNNIGHKTWHGRKKINKWKGVYKCKHWNGWCVQFKHNNKSFFVGTYKNLQKALRAYNDAIIKKRREYAVLNII